MLVCRSAISKWDTIPDPKGAKASTPWGCSSVDLQPAPWWSFSRRAIAEETKRNQCEDSSIKGKKKKIRPCCTKEKSVVNKHWVGLIKKRDRDAGACGYVIALSPIFRFRTNIYQCTRIGIPGINSTSNTRKKKLARIMSSMPFGNHLTSCTPTQVFFIPPKTLLPAYPSPNSYHTDCPEPLHPRKNKISSHKKGKIQDNKNNVGER